MFQKIADYFKSTYNQDKPTEVKSPTFEYTLDPDEKTLLKSLNKQEVKPTVVAIYDQSGGTAYCDLTIQHLQDKGMNIVPVTPEEGLNHPVFQSDTPISGIFLPGGPNIPVHDNENPRKQLEENLIQMAQKSDIPLLGICRGQQAIGHHHGHGVADMPEDAEQRECHYEQFEDVFEETKDPNFNNKVSVPEGSQLHAALHHKLKDEDKNKPIDYHVTCLHHQHVEGTPNQGDLTVTGRSVHDGTIESVERKTGKYYTLGFQHHPEAVISSCKEERQEKLNQVDQETDAARLNAMFFDQDIAAFVEYKCAQRRQEVQEKTRNEKAARAEIGFFTCQVRKSFLDGQPKSQMDTQDSSADFTPWNTMQLWE